MDGSVDFYRNWMAYTLGFGSTNSEFWLGLEKLSALTNSALAFELRVDIESSINDWKYAQYAGFHVAGGKEKYKLSVSNYTGTAGT